MLFRCFIFFFCYEHRQCSFRQLGLSMCWNVHIWETKTREGGKRVLASDLFLCKSICGMTLGGRIFFVALSILSALFSPSSPALASPYCLFLGRTFQTQGAVLKASPDTMTLFKATNQPRATHFFRGCQTVVQIPSTSGSFPSQWNCTGFVLAPGMPDCGLRSMLARLNLS